MTWAMTTTRENVVSRKARNIKAPPLNDPAMVSRGFDHYQEHCAACHGAPGDYPSELGKGMNPQPPKLWEVAKQRTPAEIFWVVKNGIKMTGMPAGAADHPDPEIWDIVAFVEKLPAITPQDYAKMAQAGQAGDHEAHAHHHHHGQQPDTGHDHPGMQGPNMGNMNMPDHDPHSHVHHHSHAHQD